MAPAVNVADDQGGLGGARALGDGVRAGADVDTGYAPNGACSHRPGSCERRWTRMRQLAQGPALSPGHCSEGQDWEMLTPDTRQMTLGDTEEAAVRGAGPCCGSGPSTLGSMSQEGRGFDTITFT